MRLRRGLLAFFFVAHLCAALAGQALGAEATDFTLESAAGERVSLGRFAGQKAVLLVFWATWCPHCNAAVPAINEIQSRLPDRLKVLAIDFLESREKVLSFMKAKNVSYTVLLDRDGTVARKFRVVGIPTYVVVDRNGRIVYSDNALPESIEKYL
jgi:peroxiredoxin